MKENAHTPLDCDVCARLPAVVIECGADATGPILLSLFGPTEEMFGVKAQDLLASPGQFWSAFADEDVERILRGLTGENADGKSNQHLVQVADAKTGSAHRVLLSLAAHQAENDQRIWTGILTHSTALDEVFARAEESEARFRNTVSNVPGAVFRYRLQEDGTDQVEYMSDGCERLWEVPAETVTESAQCLWEMAHPDDLQRLAESVAESAINLASWQCAWRITTPSGKKKWLQAAGLPRPGEDNSVVWDSLILDVTDRIRAEESEAVARDKYRLLAEHTNDLIFIHDGGGRCRFCSPSAITLLGIPEDSVEDFNLKEIVDAEDLPNAEQRWALEETDSAETFLLRVTRNNGDLVWLECQAAPLPGVEGAPPSWMLSCRDVSERIRIETQLRHDALHDSLTGLSNRTHLMSRLNLAIARIQRDRKQSFAVLYLDLDNFKIINDSLGHSAGDAVLIEVSSRLQTLFRTVDMVSRIGGDEFVILLEDAQGQTAYERAAERIISTIKEPISLGTRRVSLSASIGVVVSNDAYNEPNEVIRDADNALYRAKAKGKGVFELFDTEMHRQALERLDLEHRLRGALDEEGLHLVYQPIVDIKSREIAGFEALARWQDSALGAISPARFIPLAEETGLIAELDRFVFREALERQLRWQELCDGRTPYISVNASVRSLGDNAYVDYVESAMRESGLRPDCITLEITEGLFVDTFKETRNALFRLKDCGLKISIDDFGTGYSSLSYLYRLPVDTLKVDRSFVSTMLDETTNEKIVTSVIWLTDQLDINAVAEGVETQPQADHLHILGCEYGQGYLFSRPVDVDAATDMLRSGVAA